MVCTCQTNSQKNQENSADSPSVQDIPHSITPGQSCIFCAQKHVAAAISALSLGHNNEALGDLELARRHTAVDFSAVCMKVSKAEYAICVRQPDLASIVDALCMIDKLVQQALDNNENIDTVKVNTSTDFKLRTAAQANNPFVGEIHLCAAYRLAFEVGYMMQNKAMIIGDMTYAAEHLVHHFYEVAENIRERRHYIQTTRASDINMYWPYVVNKVSQHIDQNLTAYTAEYADGLAKWLGVSPDEQK